MIILMLHPPNSQGFYGDLVQEGSKQFKGGTELQEINNPNREGGKSFLPEHVVLGWPLRG